MENNIQYVKGIGPIKSELIGKELGLISAEELIFYFPFRYVDRSIIHSISSISDLTSEYQLVVKVVSLGHFPMGKHKKGLQMIVTDGTGYLKLVWYQKADWIINKIKIGTSLLVFGKVSMSQNEYQMAHPEFSTDVEHIPQTFVGIYSTTEKLSKFGLDSVGFSKIMKNILTDKTIAIEETLPASILNRYRLLPLMTALEYIHFPRNLKQLENSRRTLKFMELFYLQLELVLTKQINLTKNRGIVFAKRTDFLSKFYKEYLPFELTNAQKSVVREINSDFHSGHQMNRLIQGDVGSGKTLVALLAMLITVDGGYQATLMAPTEILAQQHYQSFMDFLKDLPIRIALLSGSLKNSKKISLIKEINEGKIDIVIGTHALIEDRVKFKNLGLSIIDEQHRFGVEQRSKLWKNSKIPPHILVMTATPIPRTLAMTIYGDLDISIIDELPPGRKPILTKHTFEKNRAQIIAFMQSEITKGRQVYVVYPLIEESENLDFKDLMAGYEMMCNYFPQPKYQISIVHGKLKPEVKEYEMQRFIRGETQIMVATTVIEVGVNVPNASMMVIESAERFGLSQLHQLRGRVGRGAEKSYCILVTKDKLSKESRRRMTTMVSTNDGFKIAEVDMELRGPGNIMGTEQSGVLNFKIANLVTDGKILEIARKEAIQLFQEDPKLLFPENQCVRNELNKRNKDKPNWSQIS